MSSCPRHGTSPPSFHFQRRPGPLLPPSTSPINAGQTSLPPHGLQRPTGPPPWVWYYSLANFLPVVPTTGLMLPGQPTICWPPRPPKGSLQPQLYQHSQPLRGQVSQDIQGADGHPAHPKVERLQPELPWDSIWPRLAFLWYITLMLGPLDTTQ